MKTLLDFLPVIVFFVAYKSFGLMTATLVLMAATSLQMLILWIRHRKLENSQLVTLGVVLVLGGATLILKNESFIKWKPTAVYWIMAATFVGGRFVGSKKPVMERLLAKSVKLPDSVWSKLDWSWVIFFVVAGSLNLAVAYHFDTDVWVNFKLFGLLGLTLVFALCQGVVLSRYVTEEPKSPDTKEAQQCPVLQKSAQAIQLQEPNEP